ncbi:MAG: hypothetical protein LKM31_00190 [Sphingobium sp.]|uniref:hypothetical protein n=1 Tax=Sphingobium sp. JS3065 TaxID=2970925 RepID=UPI002263C94A|nr:hypothetical protein [Sphingobium sp. JS3065]MCI1754364.1 hypothetical protein [Sphingobium sp.]UZW56698.1 hypothetical protein NUH86_08105 [Sphingobium sp. JS3065]
MKHAKSQCWAPDQSVNQNGVTAVLGMGAPDSKRFAGSRFRRDSERRIIGAG